MALKVTNAPSTAKITVRNSKASDGLGLSTYNPQQTAPSTVLQNPATVKTYQPAAAIPKTQTYNPQAVAQAAAIAQAQAIAAAAQAKQILKVQVQGQINSKTAANTQSIKLAMSAPSWKGNLKVNGKMPNYKITLPEQTEYDKAYAKAYYEALADFDNQRFKGADKKGFSKLWDKVTFGQDTRDRNARSYAEAQAKKIMDSDFSGYENKINAYIKKQATVQDAVNKAAQTMTEAQYNKFVAEQQAAIDKEYKSLVDEGAGYEGRQAAYGKSSERALTSFSAKAVSKTVGAVKTVASDKNPIWRATLGNGWENVPSIVRAPSRAVNWIGNLNTKDRTINEYGGDSMNRAKTGKNAWQATYNQRNFNIKPWIDRPFDRKEAEKRFGEKAKKDADFYSKYPAKKGSRQWKEEQKAGSWKMGSYEDQLKRYWNGYNFEHRFNNSLLEFGADPLIAVGEAAKGVKYGAEALGVSSKLSEAGRASKLTSWGFKAADKVAGFKSALAETKTAKWLTAEHKTPGEAFNETRQAVRDLSRAEQERLLKKVQTIGEKLAQNPKYDLSIFDDLKAMSPKELEVLQRMSGDGKLALRDRLLTMGKNGAPARAHFEEIAKKYINFTEQMKLSDNVKTTRFGLGKSKIYSPKTAWADDLEKYNFRLFRKGRQVQSGEDFLHGVSDRFFKSKLDEDMVAKGKNYQRYSKEFKAAGSEYTKSFETAKEAIGAARSKLKRDTTGVTGWVRNKKSIRDDVSLGRSVWNTAKNVQAAPTKIWKKSVLNLRPAWTVNNVLYNTQAGVLAGGSGSLAEQAKMLNPRYWRNAMDEGRGFRGNLGKEIGKGWGNKFYAGVEDWSRVAAGRAALKKGLTEDQALKRVNKYLFDYKTANWERPIKAAVPFWSFQKNLAKAATTMPFDRPIAAKAYNSLDRYQQTQYDQEFAKLVPQLTELGYTEQEIQSMKEEQAKYFRGRLKVGSRWITTPFNAFSEKGLTNTGLNPFLAAGQEVVDSVDSFGRKVKGNESSLMRRLISKFPQAEIGRQWNLKRQVDNGSLKPSIKYIGKAGSEGYGMGKEKQGFDPTKPNYVKSLDPRNKFGDNVLAFAGVPKSFQFDEKGFVKGKMLQKLTGDYFSLDTKGMKWDDAEVARQKLFDKYGVTADEFYKGILSKYDSENTTRIKDQKEVAKVANNLLFDEYGKQAYGTRSAWAVKKLEELTKSGYYKDNPFLYSFVKSPNNPKGFLTPDSINKIKVGQAKKSDYETAIRTGDWSAYAKKYGVKSEKARLVQQALATGDWTAYRAKYGGKSTPHQFAGKYFKTAETMEKYKEGQFWNKYGDATPEERKQMLAENPQYNRRSNWTAAMWLADKKSRKAELKKRATGFGDISAFIAKNTADTAVKATKYQGTLRRRQKKVVWKLS